jgi:hypothetical protein
MNMFNKKEYDKNYCKKYYRKHKKKAFLYLKNWRKENPEYIREYYLKVKLNYLVGVEK